MHNNFYFFRQLSARLAQILKGTVVSECFSQNRDELIVRFETTSQPFFLKAGLTPSFSFLSFPENFNRARKNSVNLFDALIGQRVESIYQFENERSFYIQFTDQYCLLFKMHGSRSNLLLYKGDDIVEVFRNNIPADLEIVLRDLDRKIDWSYDAFVKNQANLQALYFTFGKTIWKYLEVNHFSSASIETRWTMIKELLSQLENPSYHHIEFENHFLFSLIPFGIIKKSSTDPLKAITQFASAYLQQAGFQHEKLAAVALLKGKIAGSLSYIKKVKEKFNEIEHDSNYKIWADLLMANLHAINQGDEKVVLPDFYTANKMVEIKLKKDLSPQKNAEAFYRKGKNQHIEMQRLQKALIGKEEEKSRLNNVLTLVETAPDLQALREVTSTNTVLTDKPKTEKPLPYHEFISHNYKIWVGKNAQSNDVLTFKLGYKEDLWLHAKDVAGSHVLIKHQSGKNFPKDVIERAAQLAAFNSKRKNETLCPVIVTPKKFVRKRKGDTAGIVVIDREEVIMVEPRLE